MIVNGQQSSVHIEVFEGGFVAVQIVANYNNEYVFFIPRPPVNFHINRGDFLLRIRGGPWDGPWTGSMDRVHGVVHGPGPWRGPWIPVHVLYTSVWQHMEHV